MDWFKTSSWSRTPIRVTELMHFLKYMMDWVRPVGHAALDKMKWLSFWISVQVRYTHPAREVKAMRPQYLHTGKRRLMNHEELEDKLQAIVETILLHKAHFVTQSSGLVLADVLTFGFKVCEFLPRVGREFKQLPTLLAKKKAIVNVKLRTTDVSGMLSPRHSPNSKKNKERPHNYTQLFPTFNLDQIQYDLEIADIPAIPDKLGMGINIY